MSKTPRKPKQTPWARQSKERKRELWSQPISRAGPLKEFFELHRIGRQLAEMSKQEKLEFLAKHSNEAVEFAIGTVSKNEKWLALIKEAKKH